MWTRNDANCRFSIFPKGVACMQRAAGKPTRAAGASPSWLMSDQQARLSGRERGCQPLDRSVAGNLQDLLSEPSPLPQIKAHVATATHTVH
jgi:hypothetical protein